MKLAEVDLTREYMTRVGDDLVRVRIVRAETKFTHTAAGERQTKAFRVARVDTGATLPKLRTAAALREAT